MELNDIFGLQQILCEKQEGEDLPATISSNIEKFISVRQLTLSTFSSPTDTRGFVYCCVDSLKLLVTTLPSPPDLVLSVPHQNTLSQLLEMVMGFGVAALCDPGVCPVSVATDRHGMCPVQRNVELNVIVLVLKPIVKDNFYGSLVLSKYLGILIAAIINILYGPNNPSRIIKQNKDSDLVQKSGQINTILLKEFLDELLYRSINVVTEIINLQLPKNTIKPPIWLLAVTNDLMRLQVTRPNGVINVTRALFDHYGKILAYEDQSFCDKISAVIISAPRNKPEDYIGNIIEQTSEMLENLGSVKLRQQYLQLYKNMVHNLTADYPEKTFAIFWRKVFEPCCVWNKNEAYSQFDKIVVKQEISEKWLKQLETVATLGLFQNSISDRLNTEFLYPLLHLYHHVIQSVSPNKSIIHSIISELIATSTAWNGILLEFLSANLSEPRNIVWDHGDSGGFVLKHLSSNHDKIPSEALSLDPEDILGDGDRIVEVVMKLIKSLPPDRNDQLSEFFLTLFRELIDNASERHTADNFLDCPSDLHDFQSSLRKGLLLDQLCTSFGQKLLKNTTQTIEILKIIIIQKSENPSFEKEELLLLSFGILSTYLRDEIDLLESDEKEIKSLMDPLFIIMETTGNPEVSKMANDLRICIATKINLESLPSFLKEGHVSSEKVSLSDIIRDLGDPLIPSRAHAIVQLGKRFMAKDPVVIENVDVLQKVLMDNLSHDDSYVFLAAVQCLSQISWHDTQTVLDLITLEIQNVSRKEDDRAKCMEVLVNVIKITNELLPKYESQIFNCLIKCVNHQNSEIMRISSLSNIAELCKFCKFGILAHIQEITAVCEITLLEDESILAKKGAITIIANFIESQDKSLFHELQAETLRLYRLLKKVSVMSTDDEIEHQALLALGVLSTIVREFMFPKTKIQHEIKIL